MRLHDTFAGARGNGAMSNALRRDEGFSLAELMIAIAIIGVLAAIAIPNYQGFISRVRQSEAKGSLATIFAVEAGYMAEYGSYTTCLYQAGYAPETTNKYYATGFIDGTGCLSCATDNTGAFCDWTTVQTWPGGTRTDTWFDANLKANTSMGGYGVHYYTVPSPTQFRAGAIGSISSSSTYDNWGMDQDKVLTHDQDGG